MGLSEFEAVLVQSRFNEIQRLGAHTVQAGQFLPPHSGELPEGGESGCSQAP